MRRLRFTVAEAGAQAGEEPDPGYAVVLRRGTLELGLYAPAGRDHQGPHEQDEVYVVVSGRGRFLNGGVETEFGPGDAILVPAGVEHRFLEFGDDLRVWVIFYGPSGGEIRDE